MRRNLSMTVLGSSSSIPRSKRACSSYLIRSPDATLICDLGPGSFANSLDFVAHSTLNAVVITHMHADHFLDLVLLRNALKYASSRVEGKLPVYLPGRGEDLLRAIGCAVGADSSKDFFEDVFEIRPYGARSNLEVRDLRLTFAQTVHFIEAYAVRVQRNDAAITYSADTAPCADVVKLARASDVFLCESTLGPYQSERGLRGHSSAREAASMAREAGVEKLVLTHYGSEWSAEHLGEEARRSFAGECVVADDFLQVAIE
ncbi:MAG: MBL fold metallo-hydrolase [Candidatus Eremiobacteraeota bacterium]|nr:MBL fold metallo-hydrolase [Candidatus Eremiobacteraeota bacterium]